MATTDPTASTYRFDASGFAVEESEDLLTLTCEADACPDRALVFSVRVAPEAITEAIAEHRLRHHTGQAAPAPRGPGGSLVLHLSVGTRMWYGPATGTHFASIADLVARLVLDQRCEVCRGRGAVAIALVDEDGAAAFDPGRPRDVPCPECRGTGYVLTPDGRTLAAFIRRHDPAFDR